MRDQHGRFVKEPGHDVSEEARDDHGRWTSSGFSEETAAHEVHLQKEAKAGIAKVDALLNEAAQTADYTASDATDWESLSAETRAEAEDKFLDKETEDDSYGDSARETADEWVRDQLSEDPDNELSARARKNFEDVLAEKNISIDPASLDEAHSDGHLDRALLRHADGSEFTREEKVEVSRIWDNAYSEAEDHVRETLEGSDRYLSIADETQREYIQNAWDGMSDNEKFTFAQDYITVRTPPTPGLPSKWVWDSSGDDGGRSLSTDYDRTRAIANRLAEMRTSQVLQERGLANAAGAEGVSGRIADSVWSSWKDSSTSDMGLALQYAAADELGGVHRLSKSEIEDAFRATTSFAPDPETGMQRLKAYVRAQWETTQYVLHKANTPEVNVYRGLILPYSTVEGLAREDVSLSDYENYQRFTDVKLQRSGAQSTSAKPSVANAWNGVGVTSGTRVVLRVKAPATSALSLPVFGQNVHEESEVVLIGSKGAWKWDAWSRTAPPVSKYPIKAMRKGQTLVIDFRELDRGPHWLSRPKPKHWAGIVKAAQSEHEPDLHRVLSSAWKAAMRGVSMTELRHGVAEKDYTKVADLLEHGRPTRAVLEPRLASAFLRGATHAHDTLLRTRKGPLRASLTRVNPKAAAWAKHRSAELVVGTDDLRAAVREIIDESVKGGVTVDDTAELLRDVVGLDPRRAGWAANYARDLHQQGVGGAELWKHVTRYTDELRDARAETIARTEILMATNAGQQTLWEEAKKDGHLDDLLKVWITTDGCCDDCEELEQDDPINIEEPFDGDVMFPPLHPNCRCAMGLVKDE
jgi:hypothetical protein